MAIVPFVKGVVMEKSKGQSLIERIAGWLGGYMAFSEEGTALVLALWAVQTWVSERFDATPYLAITAMTKQSGKTRLLKLLKLLSRGGKEFADMTPAAMFAFIEESDCKVSLFFDEAEKLSSAAAGVLRSVMNTGYTQGQVVTRRRPGGVGTIDYRVFCCKAFALIGDVNDTLRDRSIVVQLKRGKPAKDMIQAEAKAEAAGLVEDIRHCFAEGWPTEWLREDLDGREREIWSSMFGVARALKFDKSAMGLLTRTCYDMVSAKTDKAARYNEVQISEEEAIDISYGERAIRDLLAVMGDDAGLVSSAAVEKMRAIDAAPWRKFKGDGLTEVKLSNLVSRFKVTPDRLPRKRGQAQLRGYRKADVVAAVKGLSA